MLKINLLPAYIIEQEKIRKFATIFGVLVLAVIVGMLFYYKTLRDHHNNLKNELAAVQVIEQRVKQLQAETQKIKSDNQTILNKVKFINDVLEYNLKVPRLYRELAKYTYKNIVYSQITVTSNQITIEAYARNISDAGQYLLNLYKATHLFSSVSINAVPGYPAAVATVSKTEGQQPLPQMVPGAVPMTGMPAGPEMRASVQPTSVFPYAPITSPLSRALSASAQQQQEALAGHGFHLPPLKPPKKPPRPVGFTFTVTCILKEPITPPVYGQTAGAAGPDQGIPGAAPPMGGVPPAPGPLPPEPPAGGMGGRTGASGEM